jgi:hypothetical protein
MQKATRLLPMEHTDVDARRVRALVRDMGQPSAERLLGRALDEIADRLRAADRAFQRGDTRTVVRAARQVTPIAQAVGLPGIARVAGMVAETADAGDGAAVGATLWRLQRLSDGAVRAIGETWAARL